MLMELFVLVLLATLSLAASNETQCEVNVPGFTHHGNCTVLCHPASWTDVVLFFSSNYVAHAATVISRPGQSLLGTIVAVILALLFPSTGLLKGVGAIASFAIFAPTELQMAAKAGALCIVVRYIPDPGTVAEALEAGALEAGALEPRTLEAGTLEAGALEAGTLKEGRERAPLISPKVHGAWKLPEGYSLMVLPGDSNFEDDPEDEPLPLFKKVIDMVRSLFRPRNPLRTSISNNYNFVKIVAATVQLISASATLYHARGDQIAVYGFTAFGVTVIPYAWMSLVNLLGSILCPQYPGLYLVESKASDELRRQLKEHNKSAEFPLKGVVGRITADTEVKLLLSRLSDVIIRNGNGLTKEMPEELQKYGRRHKGMLLFVILVLVTGGVPLIVTALVGLGGPSPFSIRDHHPDRVAFVLSWFFIGATLGPIASGALDDVIEPRPLLSRGHRRGAFRELWVLIRFIFKYTAWLWYWFPVLCLAIGAVFPTMAIGGFVMVGQMVVEYGVCRKI